MQRIVLGALVALSFAGSGMAASVREMTLDRLIAQSDIVVYGRVLESRCVYDAATRTIWTDTEVTVLDPAKGRTSRSILVSEPGGVIGDVAHYYAGVPRFASNQEVVLFLYRSGGKRLRVTGLQQGVYRVATDPATGWKFAGTGSNRGHGGRLDDLLASIRRKAAAK